MRFAFRPGDLLFQDGGTKRGAAITAVTVGWGGAAINHVAIYAGRYAVVEAIEPSVHLVPLEQFLRRSLDDCGHPRVIVGRPVDALRWLAPGALAWALGRIGLPYDPAFSQGDEGTYCSKLVAAAFRQANGGRPVFEESPMSFCDPATGKTHPYWAAHFDAQGLPIPEGEPGYNPGALSLSPAIEIVHRLGDLGEGPRATADLRHP